MEMKFSCCASMAILKTISVNKSYGQQGVEFAVLRKFSPALLHPLSLALLHPLSILVQISLYLWPTTARLQNRNSSNQHQYIKRLISQRWKTTGQHP